MTVQTGPKKAPDYAIHREDITAVDTIGNFKRGDGINCANYQRAHIQVIPTPVSGANPTVVVYWWSEALSEFVQENPTLTKTGAGANVPYEFTVECRGRIMFVAVSVMAAGTVDAIMVSGFGLRDSA